MVYYLRRHIEGGLDQDTSAKLLRSDRRVFAVLADRYEALKGAFGVETCDWSTPRRISVWTLERQAPPEVLAITNRCPAP